MKIKRSNPFVDSDWWMPAKDNPWERPQPKWPPMTLEELVVMYAHLADDLKTLCDWGYPLDPWSVKHLKSYTNPVRWEQIRNWTERWAKTISAVAAAAAAIYALVQWLN